MTVRRIPKNKQKYQRYDKKIKDWKKYDEIYMHYTIKKHETEKTNTNLEKNLKIYTGD